QREMAPYDASGPELAAAAAAAGAVAVATAMAKCPTERGMVGWGWRSRYTPRARQLHWAMIMPTGAVKMIHATSFSSMMSCGSRSGRKAAMSQKRSATANSVEPLAAAQRKQYAKHLNGRRHPLDLMDDHHEERQQHHAAEIEDDHAGADHRRVVGVEVGDLRRAHVGRHRREEAWEEHEGDQQDGAEHDRKPQADALCVQVHETRTATDDWDGRRGR